MKLSKRFYKSVLSAIIFFGLILPAHAHAQNTGKNQAPFLKSLIVPGWGQYALGQHNTALAFFSADVFLIGGMLSVKSYGKSVRNDYKIFSAVHAGVQGDHNHDYYVDVANWLSVNDFNAQRLRNREFDGLYNVDTEGWLWDSEANRSKMENMRVKSDRAINSVYYFVGGLILNHLASALHAGKVASDRAKHVGTLQSELRQLNFNPVVEPKFMGLTVTRNF